MWHEELLSKVIARDPIWARQPALGEVVQRFTRVLCPPILQLFAGRAALGGAGQPLSERERVALPPGAVPLTAEEYKRFGRIPDQSLATHLINGAFAAYRLAALLPEHFAWDTELWNLWTLGFVLHDYGKARGVDVPASELDTARAICRKLGEELRFEQFFPGWTAYLDDIVFLAQNTQTIRGANLNLRDYKLRRRVNQLDPLRLLASFADVLVHVTEPRDVVARTAETDRPTYLNLQAKLRTLLSSEHAPRLAYHQMAETRGLLTNVLHNAAQEVMGRHGFQPYLYFADGMVYLAPQQQTGQVEIDEVVERAWQDISQALASSPTFGIDRDGKGLKVAPPLYEFLNVAGLIAAGRSYLVQRVSARNSSAAERLGKYGATDPALVRDFRVDWLGEFLAYLRRDIAKVVLPSASEITSFLLHLLELDQVSVAEAERQSGGVPLGWYYAAAHYIMRHPTLEPEDVDRLMQRLGAAFLEELRRQGLPEQGASSLRAALADYVAKTLDLDGAALVGAQGTSPFASELIGYLGNKASNRPVCSLCSSPYTNEEQAVTVVLFKPQQYSNKNRLGGSQVVRGICPICSLEMLLRQATQGATAGKLQDQKAIYLALYPAYFFTPEIAALLQQYQYRLKDLRLYLGAESLLSWMRQAGQNGALTVEQLSRYEQFLAEEDDDDLAQIKRRSIRLPPQPDYSQKTLSGLALLPLTPLTIDATDTEAWVLPAFYALALPLLLNVKVVASASFVPLYTSAAAFRETVILDSMHPTIQQALGGDRFRIDEIIPALKRLLSFYDLHTDVFAEGFDAHWGQLGAIVRDVLTDGYSVFAYYDRKRRAGSGEQKSGSKEKAATNGAGESTREGISPWDRRKYLDLYYTLGGAKDMGVIGKLVDRYAEFYRADFGKMSSGYAVLKPLRTAIDTTVNSSPRLASDDLVEIISGELNDLMERIQDGQADGWNPITTDKSLGSWPERLARSRSTIQAFAQQFVDDLFLGLCQGDRATLREMANRLNSAARFYYLTHYASRVKAQAESHTPSSNAQ